jgi:hypothetical protein
MEKIQKYLPYATIVFIFLILLKSCGTSSKVQMIEKENKVLRYKVDSLTSITLTEDKLKKIMESTVLWRTLEIEELSDKNNMPINHYKSESQK